MITKYFDFINESFEYLLMLESNVVYSDKFRQILTKIDTPVSKKLLEIENQDHPVRANYFEIKLDKNDRIEFIADRRAQEILKDEKEEYRFIGSGGGWLKHKSSNDKLFKQLNYTYEEGSNPYNPNSRDIGTIEAMVISETSGKTYCWVKWLDNQGGYVGEGVYNKDKLTLIDRMSRLMADIWSKGRQEIRIGRGVRTLLKSAGVEFTDSEYEEFVNSYKSNIDKLNDIFSNFEVVKDNDIYEYYKSSRKYAERGTLGGSCMSNARETWLEIYTENPEQVNMVILRSTDDETKIMGRALLWHLDNGKTFMDRIYYVNDSDLQVFREYASKNGWYYKKYNTYNSINTSISPTGEEEDLDITVTLNKKYYNNFPYLDTLKYFTEGSGKLTWSDDDAYDYELTGTSGGHAYSTCDTCGGDESVSCPECDGDGENPCRDCDGEGYNDCRTCDASGAIECNNCDGNGEVDCEFCDGNGEIDCHECEGSGEIDGEDCEHCNGEGTIECNDCLNGKLRCEECDGDGENPCRDCDGEGHNECEECGGDGSIRCDDCWGEGYRDCPDCT